MLREDRLLPLHGGRPLWCDEHREALGLVAERGDAEPTAAARACLEDTGTVVEAAVEALEASDGGSRTVSRFLAHFAAAQRSDSRCSWAGSSAVAEVHFLTVRLP